MFRNKSNTVVKDVYNNCKTLLKEIKNLNTWKDIPPFIDWRLDIKTSSIYLTNFFNATPIKIPSQIFSKINKHILEFIQKYKESKIAIKEWSWRTHIPNFQTDYKAINQWKRTFSTEISKPILLQSIVFWLGGEDNAIRKEQSF